MKYIGYIGSYTKVESEGVHRFELDTVEKKIKNVSLAAKLDGPTYLTLSDDNKFLYAVSKEDDKGGVTAFKVENDTLEKLNSQAQPGSAPCHVSVNKDNSLLVTANYHTEKAESYQVNADGSLEVASAVIQTGKGPHERQEKPHLHYAGFTPDENYVVVVDLGGDTITTYEVEDSKLNKKAQLKVNPGTGPRHLVFHPTLPYAYVMTELSNEVIVLDFDEVEGTFEELQYIKTIPEDFTENNQGSAIHVSSDGKFIYAGNRGHDSIAVFKINDDHKLELIDLTYTEGNWPRDFVLDPSEQFIVAANQESNTLALFERDSKTGKLTVLQTGIYAPEAVCVKFLN
ncbi:lactonase family protein [Saliterribacillus persicus]|uniref:6-phosphogluconolactonase n=1 Tax=Saliterribacillus persicus TaxID=930114 RepID=A0A368XV68_9BACI|nr:lactonase family protein [Saliterribacillus persicus]RCW71871.1 6-phosphogluconolactonase [Saliterribacillus persicus]